MTKTLLSIAFFTRSFITRIFRPKSKYYLAPISEKYGFDRGTPIDRYWIEDFLEMNKECISGRVLEVTDNAYTMRFGTKIKISDVLDIDPNNKKANIIADLKELRVISDNTYDCVILTQVLGIIDNLQSAVSELSRVIKPGGYLLITSSCFAPTHDIKNSYWRFTAASMNYLFSDKFKLDIKTYGNAYSGQCFWVGMAQEELTKEQLEYNDPRYPCVVTVKAIKK